MRYISITSLVLSAVLLNACSTPQHTANIQANEGIVRAFTAFGTQENWRAVVEDSHLFLEGDAVHEADNLQVERLAYAKGVEFSGNNDKTEFTLNIRSAPCIDQNGREQEFTAKLYYGDKTLKGCAVRGAHEHAPS